MQAQQRSKFTLDEVAYYVIRWNPSSQSDDYVRKMIGEAVRKGAKRIEIEVVGVNDVSYMERLREVLANFIAQTIVVRRVPGGESA
mgnify:CR=1 FL=1